MTAALAIFDLDGTLLPHPSAELRFVRFLVRQRRIGARAAAQAALFTARWSPRFGRHVFKKNKAYLAGLHVAEAEQLGRRFVAQFLLPQLVAPVLERLRAHQRRRHATVLLSGAPDFIVEPLAQALDVPWVIATRCATAGGRFLAAPPMQHPFGDAKVTLAEQLCARVGCTLQEVAAYADSVHDSALLCRVGTAIAVNPDRALRRLARTRGWTVIPSTA